MQLFNSHPGVPQFLMMDANRPTPAIPYHTYTYKLQNNNFPFFGTSAKNYIYKLKTHNFSFGTSVMNYTLKTITFPSEQAR